MTLLEQIYTQLQHNGLARHQEHFSQHYLGKSKTWYAVQTHEGRDFSIDAAIACLRTVRCTATDSGLSAAQQLALNKAEQLLAQHLSQQHSIAAIC